MTARYFRKFSSLAAAGAVMLAAGAAFAAVPVSITQQGVLTDTDNQPLTGTQQLEFTLYDAPTGGAIVWSDQLSTELSDTGVYSVVLGDDGNPIDADKLADGRVWLGLKVGSGPEMTPRLALTSVPFATIAGSVAPGSITAAALAPGAVTGEKVDSLPWSKITDVPAAVANPTDTLAGLGCSNGQVAVYNGSSWACGSMPVYTGANFATANQTCPANQVARGISATGELVCETDANTTYTAGTGLTLSGTQFSFNTSYGDARYFHTGANYNGLRLAFSPTPIYCIIGVPCYANAHVYFGNDDTISIGRLSASNTIRVNTTLQVNGSFSVTGAKQFVHPHIKDPTKEIAYVALEAGESGTYWRGKGRIEGGKTTIRLPEHFSLTTGEDNLTATVTPHGTWAPLYVERVSPTELVVAVAPGHDVGAVEFNYLVQGVRAGFEDFEPIRANTHFNPSTLDMSKTAFEASMAIDPGIQRQLQANGILDSKGSLNLETARKLGWIE